MNNIYKYRFLWDGTDPGWVLIDDPSLQAGLCIYNKVGHRLLHIESRLLKDALCEKLKEIGAEVLSGFPPSEVVVLKPAPVSKATRREKPGLMADPNGRSEDVRS